MPDGVSHALERLNVIRQVSDLETDPTKKLLEVIDFSATLLSVHPAHDHATNARVGTVIGEGLIGTEDHVGQAFLALDHVHRDAEALIRISKRSPPRTRLGFIDLTNVSGHVGIDDVGDLVMRRAGHEHSTRPRYGLTIRRRKVNLLGLRIQRSHQTTNQQSETSNL